MLINYGCEIAITVPRATPLICLLDVHPERRKDISCGSPVPHSADSTVDDVPRRLRQSVPPADGAGRGHHAAPRRHHPRQRQAGRGGAQRARGAGRAAAALPAGFLLGSRYCETDRLGQVAWDLFGSVKPGWTRVQAVCDFVHNHLTFGYPHARATRTALEAYEEKKGVCRDFAHLMIALCRCLNIPARYVNGYLGDIGVPKDPAPMDFSAWVEVYLENRWYTFDARHNKPRIGRIVVARGRDATDVPLINTFGPHVLKTFKVWTDERLPELQAATG